MTRDREDSLRVVVGDRAFDECGPEWAALVEAQDAPIFQHPRWARIWLEHLGRDALPWILKCEGPEAWIWPLAATHWGPYRVLRSLGEGVSDYLGPIGASPSQIVDRGLPQLVRSASWFGHLDLKCLRFEPEVMASLRTRLPGARDRVYERCPSIRTEGTFAAYLEGRKKKFRANWKRTIRRTEAHGRVAFEQAEFDEALFGELEAVERESWKWKEGTAYLAHPGRRAFLRAVLADPEIPSEIWTCRIEGELAAFAVAFRTRRSRHYYLPSFRARYSDVGTYLLGRLTEETFASELEELDLLQGDEGYKMAWATSERPVFELAAPGAGPVGWPAVLALRGRWALARSERVRQLREDLVRLVRPSAAGPREAVEAE